MKELNNTHSYIYNLNPNFCILKVASQMFLGSPQAGLECNNNPQLFAQVTGIQGCPVIWEFHEKFQLLGAIDKS